MRPHRGSPDNRAERPAGQSLGSVNRSLKVTWEDPFALAALLAGHSGDQIVAAMASGEAPAPPIAELMGMTLIEAAVGRVVFRLVPGEQHYNPIGLVHGGVASTLLDSAMGCACQTTLDAGVGWTTLELKVNFVRPISLSTGPVLAEGTIVHQGGTIITAEGRVRAERTGKLLAHGTSTLLVMAAASERSAAA